MIISVSRMLAFDASVPCAGAIPSQIGGLRALKTLKLNNNQLSGESM